MRSALPSEAGRALRPWPPALLPLALAACALPGWPARGPLTSPFGLRWRGIIPEVHRGVDMALPPGTPVRSMAPGVVRFAGRLGGYGRVVIVDHPGRITTVYAHLAELRVRAGRAVAGGEIVGLSGASGEATGPHLHFEVRLRGRPVDPVPLLGGPPPPRGRGGGAPDRPRGAPTAPG